MPKYIFKSVEGLNWISVLLVYFALKNTSCSCVIADDVQVFGWLVRLNKKQILLITIQNELLIIKILIMKATIINTTDNTGK